MEYKVSKKIFDEIKKLKKNMEDRMNTTVIAGIFALVLSLLFSITFVNATLDLPQLLNSLLFEKFPDYGIMGSEQTFQAFEELKPIGYLCLLIVLIGIIIGFLTKRGKLTFLSSITLYLPIFGHFAATMFAFAGIGILRVIWLPLFDSSLLPIEILTLGDIVFAPFFVLMFFLEYFLTEFLEVSVSRVLLFDFGIGIGLMCIKLGYMIFFFSTFNWLFAKFSRIKIIDFWIYKYSRHPQYVGLLLASYGILIYTSFLPYPKGGYVPPPSFLWLIIALLIIAISLQEELKLSQEYPLEYQTLKEKIPFMIPLPRKISNLFLFPVQKLLKKDKIECTKDIGALMSFYGIILIGFTIFCKIIGL